MKPSPIRPLGLVLSLSFVLALVSTTLSAESPSAGTTLAAHLETVEQVAARLQRQITHPEGRPEAEEELALLIDHLERLQVATAATEAELGTQLEDLRLSLLGRIRRGEQLAPREPGKPAAGEPAPVSGSGIITGQVLGTGNLPLANVRVEARLVNGQYVGSTHTDSQGGYQMNGVEDGSYVLSTALYSSIYLNETYDDIQCESYQPCQLDQATPVVIAGGGSADGIDFKLSEGGKLRGRVFGNDGLPVAGVQVKALNAAGAQKGSGVTDAAGRFTVGKLLPGTYYLATSSVLFADEVYPNLPCEGLTCTLIEGTAVSVARDEQITGLDFTLERRSALRGRVAESVSTAPIEYAIVKVYDETGSYVRGTNTNGLGEWQVNDLDAGTYFVVAESYNHQWMIYDGVSCGPGCDPTTGTPILLAPEQSLANIDFVLNRLGSVTGSVTAAGAEPLTSTWVDIYDATGDWVDYEYGPGDFDFSRLYPGNHFVRVVDHSGYQSELWENIYCSPTESCPEVTTGTPIAVSFGQTTTGIDVVLEPMGRIEGQVLDNDSGQPIIGADVSVYNAISGYWIAYGETDDQGRYRIGGLRTGNFKVAITSDTHRAELWNGIVCNGSCDPALGQNVAVTLGQTTAGIDFLLEKQGYLTGMVRDQATLAPISDCEIQIYDASGNYRYYTRTAQDGTFTSQGLPDGTYYAKAVNRYQRSYLSELYSGFDCRQCAEVTSSTPIVVTLGQERPGIDFTLVKGGSIGGNTVDFQTGLFASASVSVYDSKGQYLTYSSSWGANEYLIEGLEAGTYFLVGDPSSYSLATEIWPGISCSPETGACNPLLGTPVVVILGATTTAHFAFDRLGQLAGRIFDSETGAPLGGGAVYLVDVQGNYRYVNADAQGSYLAQSLYPGNYKIVSVSHSNHIERVLGGSACEAGGCDPSAGTPIPVQLNQTSQAPDLLLDFGPGIAGWVRREGTAAQGVGIDVWSLNGTHLATAASDAHGRFRVGVPSGSYYVTTDNGPLFVDEVWNEVSCPNGPAYLGLCNPLLGDTVAAPAGQPAPDLVVFDLESRTAVFRDGFESGHVGNWSQAVGFVEP